MRNFIKLFIVILIVIGAGLYGNYLEKKRVTDVVVEKYKKEKEQKKLDSKAYVINENKKYEVWNDTCKREVLRTATKPHTVTFTQEPKLYAEYIPGSISWVKSANGGNHSTFKLVLDNGSGLNKYIAYCYLDSQSKIIEVRLSGL